MPGRVALFFKYDILTVLSKRVRVICVTGTNGKTTTCALLEHALKGANRTYFINKSGANMLTGVTAAFVENCSILGRCRTEFAILECDENSLPQISRYLDAEVLAVTNIFRDQLDRYGEISHTLDVIKASAENMSDSLLVINADCPLTNSLSKLENPSLSFGVGADFGEVSLLETRYCPICSAELRYNSRVFSHLGKYSCPRCGFCRGVPEYEARDVELFAGEGSQFTVSANGVSHPCKTSLGGVYNVYNFVCAAAVLGAVGISDVSLLTGFSGAFGRMETFSDNTCRVLLMLVKNPVGFSSCAAYAASLKNVDRVLLALNDNAADGRDVSWIWDSELDSLCSLKCDFYTFGVRADDMTVRLKYNGITVADTLCGEDMSALIHLVKQGGFSVILANYTAMMKLRRALRRTFGGKEFWQ